MMSSQRQLFKVAELTFSQPADIPSFIPQNVETLECKVNFNPLVEIGPLGLKLERLTLI